MRPDARWAAVLAALTLACVLAVIGASASIRLGTKLDSAVSLDPIHAARLVRQNVGAVAALGVLALAIATNAVRETRAALGPASAVALALTVLLSIVGLATGIAPPRAAAFTNQFCGVMLAGILGWIWGRAAATGASAPSTRRLASVAVAACILQAAFGGAVATFLDRPPVMLLMLHAAMGLAVAACVFGLARECRLSAHGWMLAAFGVGVPLIGLLVALQASVSALQVAHALAGAALLAAASYVRARFALA